METNEKISQLENEIKVLKNEVQAVLIDLRENFLNTENPFNTPEATTTTQQIIVSQSAPPGEQKQERRRESPVTARERHEADSPVATLSDDDEAAPESPASVRERHGAEPPADALDSDETEPMVMRVSDNDEARPETAQEEVVRARQPLPDFYSAGLSGAHATGRKMDIITIAGLAHWVEESTRRLGKERTVAVLTISEKMGYLPPDIKQVLANLINIKPNGNGDKIGVRHYLDALVKITTLLGKGNESEAALLSILSEEDDHR